jgi:hypothetical protein
LIAWNSYRRVATHMAAAVAAAVIAVGAVACGSDDDSDGGDDSTEAQVQAVLDDYGAALREADGRTACTLMSEEGKRQYEQLGQSLLKSGEDYAREFKRNGLDGTCAGTVTATMKSDKLVEDLDPRVLSVRVTGGTAVVTAKSSHDPKPERARLVKEGGTWKVLAWYTN